MTEVRPNFRSCCRLCLTEKPDRAVFGDGSEDRALQQKILSSVAVEITSHDKLSTMVCSQCVEKINDWQVYKQFCSDNQSKLDQLMQSAEMGEMNIQIKEEPMDQDVDPDVIIPEVVMNGMKNEMVEEEYNELPPPLTPHTNDDAEVEFIRDESSLSDSGSNPKKCPICDKLFSSVSNRKKHEKTIHNIRSESDVGSISQDERSQSSIDDSQLDSDTQKIQFAAGLKLLQRNSTPPISFENLSKIEFSYIEKCKAMAIMYKSLKCACHNVLHPNLKGLLSHLRSLRIWFPVFTCYHCMITFTDRSSSTRHHLRCGRSNLETLIKLSNLKKRSEVKTRLYQNYKCTKCKFMYSFHEDFCTHVDEDHTAVHLPKICSCGRIFNTIEDYKDHAYISCLVEFYCDICFQTFPTLEQFQKHAVEAHDSSEGFELEQNDNYRQRRPPIMAPVKREKLDGSVIVTGKRRTSYKPAIYESETTTTKVLNPLSSPSSTSPKFPGTSCPICCKEYSNNHNMLRHYKTHLQPSTHSSSDQYDDSLYCCPDCGGMFSSYEWEKHKEQHKKKNCNECGKVFQFQSELDQHRSVHLNLKVYKDSKTQSYKSTMLSPNSDNIMVMCEVCDTMFTSKEQLKEHKLTHEQMPILETSDSADSNEKPKRFSCKMCNKHYAGYGGLWDHNRKKHPENKTPTSREFPKKCKYCDKVFYTGGSYFMHKQMHERIEKNSQAIQRRTPNLLIKSKREINHDDDDESYYTCKRCFKVFSTKSNLKNHMKCHGMTLNPAGKVKTKLKKVWCDVCHSAFDNITNLERHKVEEHATESEDTMPSLDEDNVDIKMPFVFTCDICVQTFTSKVALKKHKEKHLQEMGMMMRDQRANLVYCKYCKISFETGQMLNNHMVEEHSEQKFKPMKQKTNKFVCNVCRKHFNSPAALAGHQGWHKRGRLMQQSTTTTTTSRQMIKTEPEDVPQFRCTTCAAYLPNDTALQIHILEKHRNVNATILPARCTMCNLDFNTQDDYDKHKRYHEKANVVKVVKSFACTYCTATFSKGDNLNTHIRQFHTKSEYKCLQCGRVFDKQNSLSIHLKVHEKQKSAGIVAPKSAIFSCSICSMGFDIPKDLRRHTIEAHPF